MGQPTPRDGDLEPHFNTFSYFRKTPCLMLPRVCDDDIRLNQLKELRELMFSKLVILQRQLIVRFEVHLLSKINSYTVEWKHV